MLEFILLMGIPTAITGFLFWILKREINKTETRREEREKNMEQLIFLIMETSRSTNVLAEATARAVQRIPEAHCNGDMTAALEQSAKFQKEEQEFIIQQGVKNIFDKE